MDIEGAVALVTGANRGLGKAFVDALLAGGAGKVYAACRQPASHLDERVVPLRLDVTSPTDITAAAKNCPDVTILVNNAGIMLTTPILAPGSDDALRREIEVNVFGVLAMARSFAPLLARNGGGAIINVLSVASWFVNPFNATYCTSKHAALAVTNALRIELCAQGTRVLGVHAGFIDTDMARHVAGPKSRAQDVADQALHGLRFGEDHVLADSSAIEIHDALAADRAAFERGQQSMWDQGASPWTK